MARRKWAHSEKNSVDPLRLPAHRRKWHFEKFAALRTAASDFESDILSTAPTTATAVPADTAVTAMGEVGDDAILTNQATQAQL